MKALARELLSPLIDDTVRPAARFAAGRLPGDRREGWLACPVERQKRRVRERARGTCQVKRGPFHWNRTGLWSRGRTASVAISAFNGASPPRGGYDRNAPDRRRA